VGVGDDRNLVRALEAHIGELREDEQPVIGELQAAEIREEVLFLSLQSVNDSGDIELVLRQKLAWVVFVVLVEGLAKCGPDSGCRLVWIARPCLRKSS
jgi:hypothetical protein